MIQIDWMIGNASREIFQGSPASPGRMFPAPFGEKAAILVLQYQSIFADEVQVDYRTIDVQQLKESVFRDFPAAKM